MILDVKAVHAYYGKSHVLQGVSLNVRDGETVTLLGRNGAGKSTTLKTIAGVVAERRHGDVRGPGDVRSARAPDCRTRRVSCRSIAASSSC
jgi:ABC-type branched-subunit amino acid transport system ATPase component